MVSRNIVRMVGEPTREISQNPSMRLAREKHRELSVALKLEDKNQTATEENHLLFQDRGDARAGDRIIY